MIKTTRIPIAALLAAFTLFVTACDLFTDQQTDFDVLEENTFYAQNMIDKSYYKVQADMLYEGDRCFIWAEKGSGVTQNQARVIAHTYDDDIRPTIVGAFGMKDIDGYNDILDYANSLAGRNDKKLTILLLDIKDGFKNPNTDSFVAGYFFSGNFYPPGRIPGYNDYSNGRDMIYVDTYPGLSKDFNQTDQTYATFAHELQHLINYVTSIQTQRNLMDVWVDEGLSSQAEYLYLRKNPPEKCEWFSGDKNGTIARGNNFFVWDNHGPQNILDEYATVYLFFRWLYLQADDAYKSSVFYDIITSESVDWRAVTGMARKINSEWSNWETLLRTWLAANYYPENEYGYTGDEYLQRGGGDKNFSGIKVNPIAGQTTPLYPGEGVYSIIQNDFSRTGIGNIRYAGLSGNESGINTVSPYRGNVLLTFNANTSKNAAAETGYLTGVTPPARPARSAMSDAQNGRFTGPYVIDARDLLGRDAK